MRWCCESFQPDQLISWMMCFGWLCMICIGQCVTSQGIGAESGPDDGMGGPLMHLTKDVLGK